MTTNNVAAAFENRFRSFGLSENPFHISPDPRFLFAGRAYGNAIADLQKGIGSRSGLMVLTGEAGTGKTTLMRYLLQWLAERRLSTSYIFHAHLDPAGLFEFILRDFGVPVLSTKKTDLVGALYRWLTTREAASDTPVVIIDEAQALPVRTLSELCLLLNLEGAKGKLVQVILAGQPELDDKLHRPDLHALRQRISKRCRLPVLTLDETAEYIQSRLQSCGTSCGTPTEGIFPTETVRSIYSYARGIPRVVNLLCEHAMEYAYADGKAVVAPANVRRAASEFDLAGEPYNSVDLELALERPQASSAVAGSAMRGAAAMEAIPMVVEIVTPLVEPAAAARVAPEKVAEKRIRQPSAPTFAAPPFSAAAASGVAAAAAPALAPAAAPIGVSPAGATRVKPAPAAVPASSPALGLAPMRISLPERGPDAPASLAARLEIDAVRPTSDGSRSNIAATKSAVAAAKSSLVEFRLDSESGRVAPKLVAGEWKKNAFDAEWRRFWNDVSTSFWRDVRVLKASAGPAIKDLLRAISAKTRSARQVLYEPFCKWLRTPVSRAARDANHNASSSNPAKS